MGWMILGSIPGRSKTFYLLQNVQIGSVAHPSSYKMVTWGSVPGVTQLRCEANRPPPSMLRLRMSGAISSPFVCLYFVERGTTYCTFASINDCVTYPANCPMVSGDSWHRCQARKTLSCLPSSSADVNVWSFTVTFHLTCLCGMALWCLENFI